MNSTNLMQHQLNKFGVVTVMDILLLDTVSNEPVLFLDTLKITSLNQEGEQKEIRGGIGAPKLISYDFARTVTLEIQDALASMASLKTLWGGSALKDKDTFNYTAIFEAKVGAAGEVAIPVGISVADAGEEEAAKILVLNNLDQERYEPVSVASQTITLKEAAAAKDKTVKVFVPAEATIALGTEEDNGFMAMAINSVDMPPTLKMIGQTFFIDQASGKKIPMQLEIPNLKINMGGGMTMEAEGDAAVFDFEAEALADPITKNFFILKQVGKAGSIE